MRRFLVLVVVMASAALAQVAPEEAATLLQEANTAHRDGEAAMSINAAMARDDFRRAARRYERLVREAGAANGTTYFNLGNSWLGAGDYGRAILAYRRALLFDPGRLSVLNNLAIARSQRAEAYNTPVLAAPAAGLGQAEAGWFGAGFVAAWLALWALLAWRLYDPQKVSKGWIASVGGAAVVLMAATLASATQMGQQHGVSVAAAGVARQGAGLGHDRALIDPIEPGEEFRILETEQGWARVRFASGETAWLSQDDFEVVEDID